MKTCNKNLYAWVQWVEFPNDIHEKPLNYNFRWKGLAWETKLPLYTALVCKPVLSSVGSVPNDIHEDR